MYSKSQAARPIIDANNIARERTESASPCERVSFSGIGQRWPHCGVLDSARIIRVPGIGSVGTERKQSQEAIQVPVLGLFGPWTRAKFQKAASHSCERAYLHLMGMLTNLISKIFSHAPAATTSPAAPPSTTIESAPATSPTSPAASAVSPAPAAPAVAPTQTVDVTAILDGLTAKNPQKLDWRKSIVDLMTLVDMDSSLSARKKLATELHYSGDENDSASMNVWLHKEVITKLAENGGKVPRELLS
jgi:Domain of unknown function (DUF3597)